MQLVPFLPFSGKIFMISTCFNFHSSKFHLNADSGVVGDKQKTCFGLVTCIVRDKI